MTIIIMCQNYYNDEDKNQNDKKNKRTKMAELVAQSILEQFKLNGKTALTVGGSRGPVLPGWMGCTVAGKIILARFVFNL